MTKRIKKPLRFRKIIVHKPGFDNVDKGILAGLIVGFIGSTFLFSGLFYNNLLSITFGTSVLISIPWLMSFFYWKLRDVFYEEIKE